VNEAILEDLLRKLRSEFSEALHLVLHEPSVLVLAVQGSEIPIRIVVDDAARPSFSVTHGFVGADAWTLEAIREVTSNGVLYQGLAWIIAQVVAHGVVLPEFPHPRLMRALRRSRRRSNRTMERAPRSGGSRRR
jgi:hypothetical protein